MPAHRSASAHRCGRPIEKPLPTAGGDEGQGTTQYHFTPTFTLWSIFRYSTGQALPRQGGGVSLEIFIKPSTPATTHSVLSPGTPQRSFLQNRSPGRP